MAFKSITTVTRQPGQGQSKKARARRNRKQTQPTTTTTTIQTPTTRLVKRRAPRRQGRLGGTESMFLKTLFDPERFSGIKWPGPTGVPTGTFQVTFDTDITTDSLGNYVVVVAPSLNMTGGVGVFATPLSDVAGTYTWAGGTLTAFPGGTQAAGIYDATRVVSGCIKLWYIGNTQTDGGEICAAWDTYQGPPTGASALNYGATRLPTISAIQALAYNETIPLRNGICSKWRPMDYSTANFLPVSQPANLPDVLNIVMSLQVSGATASTRVGHLRLIFNYEGIASSDTANFVDASKPSPHPNELLIASQWGKDMADKVTPLAGVMGDSISKLNQLMNNSRANKQNVGNYFKPKRETSGWEIPNFPDFASLALGNNMY